MRTHDPLGALRDAIYTRDLVVCGEADEGVTGADVEVEVGQRLQPVVRLARLGRYLGHQREEEAQLADLHRLFHQIDAVEIVEEDRLQDEIIAIGTGRRASDDSDRLGFPGASLHPVEAGCIEWPEGLQRGEEERPRAARRVEYRQPFERPV